MEIFVNKSEQSVQLKKEQKSIRRKAIKKLKERRKAARDRRRSVNEGLLVKLSTKKDRRVARERRENAQDLNLKEKKPSDPSQNKSLFKVVV